MPLVRLELGREPKWIKSLKGVFKRKKSDSSTRPSIQTIPDRRVDQPFFVSPSIVVNAPAHELPLQASHQDTSPDQLKIPEPATVDTEVAVSNTDTPIHLHSLLDALSQFDSTVEKISSIRPYAQAAWVVLSFASKAIIDQATQDDFIHSLISKMDDVYAFLVQKEPQDIEFMKPVVERICHQTLEWTRLCRDFFSATSERVQNYNEVFDKLLEQFHSKVIADTSVVVHRIWENLEDIVPDSDLNSMPYVAEAGLDTQKLCLEGTRNEILDEITAWINNADVNTPRVFWLNGSAGSGKSSIAHTIADRFGKLGRLGSCYCLIRNEIAQQRDKKVVTTIARDLASRDEPLRKKLASAIHLDASLKNTTDILQQWKELIVKPAMALSDAIAGPIVIIIDALDESGDPKLRAQLLRILGGELGDEESHVTRLPPHFRIFLTSRPLPDIYNILNGAEHVKSKSMDSIPPLTTKRDICHHISCQLSDLKGVDIASVSTDLASASDGLFEWARLACAFIKRDIGAGLTAQKLLDTVMTHNKDARVPLLDGMYKLTLETIFPEGTSQSSVRLSRFRSIMAQIMKTVEPLPLTSLASIRHHFADKKLREIDAGVIIKPLGALLSGTTDPSAGVRPLHASFPEFLANESRSGEFFVSSSHVDSDLAFACFGVLEGELRFNMCKLPSSYLPNSEVPDLAERIKENISLALSYSCRFWAHHLRHAQFNSTLAEVIRIFLNHERLLFWLEVMSLLKKIGTCISLLSNAIHWVKTHAEYKDFADYAADVQRFIRVFGGPVSFSTPHLYLSAIPFSPKNSHISKRFGGRFDKVLRIAKGHNESWPVVQGVLHGHYGEVNPVAFLSDGKYIASGSWDKTIRLWGAETGVLVRPPFEGHEDWVESLAFSPDGKHIVSGSQDKTIRLWDVETGELVRPPLRGHKGAVHSVVFSPDGKCIGSGSWDKTIRLWDVGSGELVGPPLEGHEDLVRSIAFSPDGRYIVSGSDDKTVRLWNAETGEPIRPPLEGHKNWVHSVSFSPDGKQILSGLYDKTIRLWDSETGKLVRPPLEGHEHWVESVAFSPDGKYIVSGSRDKTIRVWDARTGELVRPPLEGHESSVMSVAFSSGGKRIVSGSFDRTIRLWDFVIRELVQPTREEHEHPVTSVTFMPDGKCIASGSDDKTIRLWNVETGELVRPPLEGHDGTVRSIAFSPDGNYIVSGSEDKTIRLWDTRTGELVWPPLHGHKSTVFSVAFSSDGKCIGSGSWDKTIRLWNAETGKLIRPPLEGHKGWVWSVAFSPDGKHIVSGSQDKTIRLWNVETGQLVLPPLEGHKKWVHSVVFSPDGKRILSGSSDKTIRLWDTESGQLMLPPLEGHEERVSSVAFSSDGKYIVSGSFDRTIRLWDAETGELVKPPLEGHEDFVWSAAFSPDGKYIVSGSVDKTIRLWDSRTEERLKHTHLKCHSMIRFSQRLEHSLATFTEPANSESSLSLHCHENLVKATGREWAHVGSTSDLLFSIPPTLYLQRYYPSTSMIIPEPIHLDLSRMAHGHLWDSCYRKE